MLTLYQFPISHYCEKVRWALDYKQLDYQVKNLIPGLHLSTTTKLSAQTAVPILVDGDKVINGSSSIISYLDNRFSKFSLTPNNQYLKHQVLEWEVYVDAEVGVHIRRCFYYILLEHPDIVIPLFSQKNPWYSKVYFKLIFPKVKEIMKQRTGINKESALYSAEQLKKAIDKIYDHLQDNIFFVGDQFSRADLAAASLLAPLYKPDKYGMVWPASFPPLLEELVGQFQEKTGWVSKFYELYR